MKRVTSAAIILGLALAVMYPADATYLTMSKRGEGTVSPGIGANSFSQSSTVTIQATPAAGWVFSHWEGDMAGKPNPYTFSLTYDATAWAVFQPQTPSSATALAAYVGKWDPTTQVHFISRSINFAWNGYRFYIDSQTWRSASEVDRPLWQHDFVVFEPWFSDDDCLLLVNGGNNPLKYPTENSLLAYLSVILGTKYAQIDQVPNQPLYFADDGGRERTEDEVLAYSLDKALDTGDLTWPVHCAMVKSVVKAMDVVQQVWKAVDNFMVIGASKRGWATWLTAAVDPRVKCIAPIVIDVLNFPQQVAHHWESYGGYSPVVQDYVDFDLFCRVNNDPLAPALLDVVDPYRFIDRFTMPKLIMNGSSDQFFLPDSSRYYYQDLPNQAQTYLRYYPNASHYMEPLLQDYGAMLGLVQWAGNILNGSANPRYSWRVEEDGAIVVQTPDTPDVAILWQATNPYTRDFRLDVVGALYGPSQLFDQGGGVYIGYCPDPPQGWTAYFVELRFGAQCFSSRIVVRPDVEPFDGMGCF